jgi:hypothetical protein
VAKRESQVNANEGSDVIVNLPGTATLAAAAFYEQHMRDLHYFTAETTLVSTMRRLVGSVESALFPGEDPRTCMPTLWADVDRAVASDDYNWRTREPLATVRYVDNYLVYVADLIALLFRTRPEALRSSEQVSLEQVLRHRSLDDFIAWQVDERVNQFIL